MKRIDYWEIWKILHDGMPKEKPPSDMIAVKYSKPSGIMIDSKCKPLPRIGISKDYK